MYRRLTSLRYISPLTLVSICLPCLSRQRGFENYARAILRIREDLKFAAQSLRPPAHARESLVIVHLGGIESLTIVL